MLLQGKPFFVLPRSGSEAEMLMECGRRDLESVDCMSFLCA